MITAGALLAVIFLYGCQSQRSDESNVFRYNESNGITSLDPAFAHNLENMWATNQLFDGLVELDSSLRIIPSLATRWEISEDGLTYTFHLRDSVFFHTSPLFADSIHRKVIAADFVYSFSRIINPGLASPGSWIFSSVDTTKHGGFYAVDDSTLKIHLSKPFPVFLGILTTQHANVVPHEVVQHFGSDFRSHPIGTGPFRFAFWYENIALVFHRHEHFWQNDEEGNRLPYLDAVKIDFAKDMTVEYQGLLLGRYDFMSGIHSAFKDELLDPEGNLAPDFDAIYFQKTPFIKTDYLGIVVDPLAEVTKNSPLLDVRIRKAIRHAINLEEMVKHLRNNSVFAANEGFVPPVLLGSRQEAVGSEQTAVGSGQDGVESSRVLIDEYRLKTAEPIVIGSTLPTQKPADRMLLTVYNPELSRKLLAEAGYVNGKGLPEIEMASTPDYADLLEYIQHELQKVGIRTKVKVIQGAAFTEQTSNAQIALFRKSWLADYADAENFLALFHSKNFSPGGKNYTHFSNREFDSLYDAAFMRAGTSGTPTSVNGLHSSVFKMDSIISAECPVIPLYYDQVSHFIRKEISSFETNGVNMLDLKRVRKN